MHGVAVILAHPAAPPAAAATAWDLQPAVLALAALAAAAYATGLRAPGGRAVSAPRAAAFFAGVAVAVLAVVSPAHAAAEATFAGHMAQHLLLTLVAAPLVVAGRPGLVAALALPRPARRAAFAAGRSRVLAPVAALARSPLAILLAYAAVVWTWHLPGPYQAAVEQPGVHALEHASFLGVALAFWAGVAKAGPRRRIGSAPAILLVLGTMLQTTWLATVLAFGDIAYPIYATRAPLWGMTPAEDQQIAGALMLVPSTLAYFGVFATLFVRWMREAEARHPAGEALRL